MAIEDGSKRLPFGVIDARKRFRPHPERPQNGPRPADAGIATSPDAPVTDRPIVLAPRGIRLSDQFGIILVHMGVEYLFTIVRAPVYAEDDDTYLVPFRERGWSTELLHEENRSTPFRILLGPDDPYGVLAAAIACVRGEAGLETNRCESEDLEEYFLRFPEERFVFFPHDPLTLHVIEHDPSQDTI